MIDSSTCKEILKFEVMQFSAYSFTFLRNLNWSSVASQSNNFGPSNIIWMSITSFSFPSCSSACKGQGCVSGCT